jgi:hypothetical protein
MPNLELPNWWQAPNSLLEVDGHCGLLSAWMVLRHFRRRVSTKNFLSACSYTRRHGVFTVGLAAALKIHGLQVSFHTQPDLEIGGFERRCYSKAARIGIQPQPPLELSGVLRTLNSGAVPIVLFNTKSDVGHFSPLLGAHNGVLDLPLAEKERMRKSEFLHRWSEPGILRQCVIVAP